MGGTRPSAAHTRASPASALPPAASTCGAATSTCGAAASCDPQSAGSPPCHPHMSPPKTPSPSFLPHLAPTAAFLAAVQDLAGRGPTGLGTVDKAMEAVNTVKVGSPARRRCRCVCGGGCGAAGGGGGGAAAAAAAAHSPIPLVRLVPSPPPPGGGCPEQDGGPAQGEAGRRGGGARCAARPCRLPDARKGAGACVGRRRGGVWTCCGAARAWAQAPAGSSKLRAHAVALCPASWHHSNRQRLWRWFDAARHSTADAQAAPLTPPNPYSHLFPRVQRLYGFDAARYGITDAQAAAIATVFTAYDADDNGVLSLDEFQRLW